MHLVCLTEAVLADTGLGSNMNKTEAWARRQGFTPQQIRAMGLDPESVLARNKRVVAQLKSMKEGTLGHALKRHLERGAK